MQGRYSVEKRRPLSGLFRALLEHQSSPGASTRHDSLLHCMVSNCAVAMWFSLVSRASSSSSSRRHELLELLLDLEDHLRPMGLATICRRVFFHPTLRTCVCVKYRYASLRARFSERCATRFKGNKQLTAGSRHELAPGWPAPPGREGRYRLRGATGYPSSLARAKPPTILPTPRAAPLHNSPG